MSCKFLLQHTATQCTRLQYTAVPHTQYMHVRKNSYTITHAHASYNSSLANARSAFNGVIHPITSNATHHSTNLHIYICMHTKAHAHAHAYLDTCIHTFTHMQTYAHTPHRARVAYLHYQTQNNVKNPPKNHANTLMSFS